MDIYPLGHSCFKIKGKNATAITDPFDSSSIGIKFPKVETVDIVTVSHSHPDHDFISALGISEKLANGTGKVGETFVCGGPGEYEIKGVTVVGVESFHDDKQGAERGKNTIFKLVVDGVQICHLGDLGQKLTDAQVDQIGDVDVLFVPVGGFFTIDAKIAAEVVAQIEPYIVIPMHYKRSGMAAQISEKLDGVEKFLKEMGAESVAPQNKLTTSKDKLPENTTIVVLE